MKIGIWVSEYINEKEGGGASHINLLLQQINEHKFDGNIEIVFIIHKKKQLTNFNNVLLLPKVKVRYKLLKTLSRLVPFFGYRIRKKIITKNNVSKLATWKTKLLQDNIKLIYYLGLPIIIPNFPFIATNWDLAHKTTYAFPEFSTQKSYINRHNRVNIELQKALMIFTESEEGKSELANYYNININKIKVIPLFAGDVIKIKPTNDEMNLFLSKTKLNKNEYFYYPAQFWAHKNHYTLIKAFHDFLKQNSSYNKIKLVFSGSEQGNLEYIKKSIETFKLKNNVLLLGFISKKEVNILYINSIALVFPSLLGPTNMPLLEAIELNCPILCSNLKGHKILLQNSAIYFEPLNFKSILNAMNEIMESTVKVKLLQNAEVHRNKSVNTIDYAIEKIEQSFKEVIAIRSCWN